MARAKSLKHAAFLRGIVMATLAAHQYGSEMHYIGALSGDRTTLAA
jgi:hypothetical protein